MNEKKILNFKNYKKISYKKIYWLKLYNKEKIFYY